MLKSAEKVSTACGKACWKPWFTTVFGFYFSKAAKKHFFLIFIKTTEKQGIFHFFRENGKIYIKGKICKFIKKFSTEFFFSTDRFSTKVTETEFSLSFPHFAGKFSIGENRSARRKNARHIGLFWFSTFYTETTSYYFYLFFLFYILLRKTRNNFQKAHARRVEKVGTNLLLFSFKL